MAELQNSGAIVACCPGCNGGRSTFEWLDPKGNRFGCVEKGNGAGWMVSHRLFRCAGCGRGAFGVVSYIPNAGYPGNGAILNSFFPESSDVLPLPTGVPAGIVLEFREGEKCLGNNCIRAAAGMFRSVLDKTMRANGYKTGRESLAHQIDEAAKDKVITESRRLRAHDEIRVLGNDVLHVSSHCFAPQTARQTKISPSRLSLGQKRNFRLTHLRLKSRIRYVRKLSPVKLALSHEIGAQILVEPSVLLPDRETHEITHRASLV